MATLPSFLCSTTLFHKCVEFPISYIETGVRIFLKSSGSQRNEKGKTFSSMISNWKLIFVLNICFCSKFYYSYRKVCRPADCRQSQNPFCEIRHLHPGCFWFYFVMVIRFSLQCYRDGIEKTLDSNAKFKNNFSSREWFLGTNLFWRIILMSVKLFHKEFGKFCFKCQIP